jgi:hypothetical protein
MRIFILTASFLCIGGCVVLFDDAPVVFFVADVVVMEWRRFRACFALDDCEDDPGFISASLLVVKSAILIVLKVPPMASPLLLAAATAADDAAAAAASWDFDIDGAEVGRSTFPRFEPDDDLPFAFPRDFPFKVPVSPIVDMDEVIDDDAREDGCDADIPFWGGLRLFDLPSGGRLDEPPIVDPPTTSLLGLRMEVLDADDGRAPFVLPPCCGDCFCTFGPEDVASVLKFRLIV